MWTASGFNNVLISPRLSKSFPAIFLKILLIIFPDLVLGKASVNWILSNFAIGPILSDINLFISSFVFSEILEEFFKVTNPYNAFPLISWGKPTIADSATFSCSFITSSMGAVPKLCPETIITSSTLPVILKLPLSSL